MIPKELIFSGGNFATISFLGSVKALIELDELNLKEVSRFVGTSGGAVISFFLAIGYSPERIINIMAKIPMSKISKLTSDKWLTFFDNYGLHDTIHFKKIFSVVLTHMNISSDTTFKEFYDLKNIELVFTSFCLNTSKLELLNHENTPDLKLIDGLCMSIAVPLIFYPVSYRNRLYIDAFLVSNHPVELSLCKNSNESCSFCLSSKPTYTDSIDLLSYIKILMRSPIAKIENYSLSQYKGWTICIPCNYDLDGSFNIGDQELKSIFQCGYDFVMELQESDNYSSDSESSDDSSIVFSVDDLYVKRRCNEVINDSSS
tara:strand:- start:8553 stop:9500 length:948 start_codon:yes stop_codon:yes gene_type:complete